MIDLERLLAHPDDAIAIADALRAADYSSQRVVEALDMTETPNELLQRSVYCSLAYYDLEAADNPVRILGTLFTLAGWVKRDAYESQLAPTLRKLLEDYGLVVAADRELVKATVNIFECRGYLFLSDRTVERAPDDILFCNNVEDNVDPPNYASLDLLDEPLPTLPGGRFLDVGCGCGVLGLFAAKEHRETVGIDLNARAIKMASLNALVNGARARFVVADCTKFDDGERFDRIIFNSPSVPTYAERLQNVATYTSRLGYELPFRFIDTAVARLLAPQGECRVWIILAVTNNYSSIEDLLRKETRAYDTFAVSIRPQEDSPFALSRAQIANGEIPRDSYLLQDPEDGPAFMSFVKKAGVQFITPATVTLRAR